MKYYVPYSVHNSKIIHYAWVKTSSELKAIDWVKRELKPIKHCIYVNGIVVY